MIIENQKQFDQLFYELQEEDLLAIDLEFIRRRTFFAKPALMQIAWKNERVCVIDLLKINIEKFRVIWQDEKVNKILHGADQDVEILYNLMGIYPRSLFDSQIALQFLCFSDSVSYQSLIELLFAHRLDKTMQKSDWLKRPLDIEAIEYAKNDVLWLYLSFAKLMRGLKMMNRLDWFYQEMDMMLNNWKMKFDSHQYYQSINQYIGLSPEYQALLRRFCAIREELTKQIDLPRSWICNDVLLLRFVRFQPKTKDEIYPLLKKDFCHKAFIKLTLDFFSKKENQLNQPYRIKRKHFSVKDKEAIIQLKEKILAHAEDDCIHSNLLLKTHDLRLLFTGDTNNLYQKSWRKDWMSEHKIFDF